MNDDDGVGKIKRNDLDPHATVIEADPLQSPVAFRRGRDSCWHGGSHDKVRASPPDSMLACGLPEGPLDDPCIECVVARSNCAMHYPQSASRGADRAPDGGLSGLSKTVDPSPVPIERATTRWRMVIFAPLPIRARQNRRKPSPGASAELWRGSFLLRRELPASPHSRAPGDMQFASRGLDDRAPAAGFAPPDQRVRRAHRSLHSLVLAPGSRRSRLRSAGFRRACRSLDSADMPDYLDQLVPAMRRRLDQICDEGANPAFIVRAPRAPPRCPTRPSPCPGAHHGAQPMGRVDLLHQWADDPDAAAILVGNRSAQCPGPAPDPVADVRRPGVGAVGDGGQLLQCSSASHGRADRLDGSNPRSRTGRISRFEPVRIGPEYPLRVVLC